MTEPRRVGAIEVHEDPEFERREWRVQRIGWVLLLLFVVAAAAGLFGRGPASLARAGEQGGPFEMSYGRFTRYEAPVNLDLKLRPEPGQDPQLWLSSEYLKGLRIERVTPEPARTQLQADGVLYTFEAGDAQQPVEITVHAMADRIGLRSGRAGTAPDHAFDFWQFVYP